MLSNRQRRKNARGKADKARRGEGFWVWELVALLIAMACLVAIIVTVSTSHGKPLAKLPLGITLNAAISIFSTIMKTTVLFCAAEIISQSKWLWFHRQPQRLSDVELYDQASRGPWGALSMLWQVRCKYVSTSEGNERGLKLSRDSSSLAALVILFSLGIDPFAQQLTHLQLESIAVDSEASIPVQSLFSVYNCITNDCTSNNPLLNAESAVKAALVGSKIPETIASCPTGKCSWGPYQSLAVCHQCVDISDLVQIKDSCFYQTSTTCAAYLENGLTIALGSVTYSSAATRMNTTATGPLLKIDNVGQSLMNFTKLYHDPAGSSINPACFYREPSFISQCLQDIRETLMATECSLYWCINRYAATQQSGILNETLINSWWSDSSIDKVAFVEPGFEGSDSIEDISSYFQLRPSYDNSSVKFSEKNFSQDKIVVFPKHTYGDGTENESFYVMTDADSDLSLWLAEFFTRGLAYDHDLGPADNDTDNVAIILSGRNRSSSENSGRDSLIPQPDPVFDIFANVAFGLTQSVRLESYTNTSNFTVIIHDPYSDTPDSLGRHTLKFTAFGNNIVDHAMVRIRWGWLVFPVGLVFVTGALTITIKIQGSRKQIPEWGSSATALMIYGPYSHTNEKSSPNYNQMHIKAKSTKVILERSANGSWRLSWRDDTATDPENTAAKSAIPLLRYFRAHKVTETSNSSLTKISPKAASPCRTVKPGASIQNRCKSPPPSELTRSKSI
ncbi:MAG: hypothetical protein L6R41_006081 [Letrouitia leprolyta]|nr:MAG: hypothetical protein L6R41_006081 [Letrouitia leprolyta]